MEEKIYKTYAVNENEKLIELNRKEIDNKTYLVLLQNSYPNSFFVGELDDNNNVNLLTDRAQALKILKEISQDKTTFDNLKSIFLNTIEKKD